MTCHPRNRTSTKRLTNNAIIILEKSKIGRKEETRSEDRVLTDARLSWLRLAEALFLMAEVLGAVFVVLAPPPPTAGVDRLGLPLFAIKHVDKNNRYSARVAGRLMGS